jgi:hypothetical protein
VKYRTAACLTCAAVFLMVLTTEMLKILQFPRKQQAFNLKLK